MSSPDASHTGNLALVDPLYVHGTVAPTPPEQLGSQVLEIASILQTTLEVEQQIELFGREVRRHVPIDGLVYALPNSEREITYGREASERATYSLILHDSPLGSIRACRDLPFTEQELISLENLLCALIYPLRNALTYKQAVEMASRDPLTGVQNRLAMSSSLLREIDLAHRQQQPLSMLVIDIDHFKACNDQHGHAFGDDVLVATSQTIANTVRRCDLVFRFGGEEFVVLASHTGREGAMLLAERIRENIAALQTVRGRSIRVTVSVGIAQLHDSERADAFFDRADRALYAAKQGGRNRSVLA